MLGSNQLKIGVVLSYLSTGINMLIQLLYTPIMIHLLGQSEYGLYTLVGSFISYLSLFSLGFTGAYLRFYSKRKAENDTQGIARLNGMFLTLFTLMSLAALVCGMILAQFPKQIFAGVYSQCTRKVLVSAHGHFDRRFVQSVISAPAPAHGVWIGCNRQCHDLCYRGKAFGQCVLLHQKAEREIFVRTI